MWSGSIESIPSGWRLCDGTFGTPNLRDRFVVGAGTTYTVGSTGGFNTVTLDTTQIPSHTHTNSVSTGNLEPSHSGTTNNNNVDHFHGASGTTAIQNANHGHSGSTDEQGTHAHAYSFPLFGNGNDEFNSIPSASDNFNPGRTYSSSTAGAGAHNHNVLTGIQNADHAHAFSINTGGQNTNHVHTFGTGGMSANVTHNHAVTINATGGGLAHENRPPYYALAYIMRTA
jgi:microcystin-dependent protein